MSLVDGARSETMQPPAEQIRRILVTAYGHTADSLPAGPCLAALRATYPRAQIHMMVVDQVAELWRACPHVDQVHVMRDFTRKGTRLARAEQLWRLAVLAARFRGRYDIVVVLHAHSWFFALLAYLTGARYRAGYATGRTARWFTHRAGPYEAIVSFREENRRVMRALHIEVENPRLQIWPSEKAIEDVDRFLMSASSRGPLIGLHPGSHWACQRWANDRWAVVADGLVERYGAQIVITGSADERAWAEEIAEHMKSQPLIATGTTSLLGFAELVGRCTVLLCVNSAASQVGLAMKTPVVNLVGLEPLTWTEPSPGEVMSVVRRCSHSSTTWCPLGVWGRLSHCQVEEHVGLAGLESIQPDDVIDAAATLLQNSATPFGASNSLEEHA
jgi:ADP-heptose:LPS heptosyltransferase